MNDRKLIDHVVIQRVLGGHNTPCNSAEKDAVIDQWAGSWAELHRITGWNVDKSRRDTREAVA